MVKKPCAITSGDPLLLQQKILLQFSKMWTIIIVVREIASGIILAAAICV